MASYVPRYLKVYRDAVPQLKTDLAIKNVMTVPQIEKVVINVFVYSFAARWHARNYVTISKMTSRQHQECVVLGFEKF